MARWISAARPKDHEQQDDDGERNVGNGLRTLGKSANNFGDGMLTISGKRIVGFRVGEHLAGASHHMRGVCASWQHLDGFAGGEVLQGCKMLAPIGCVLKDGVGSNENTDMIENTKGLLTNKEITDSWTVVHRLIFYS